MSVKDRIDKMYRSDVRYAILLVVLLWAVLLFVLFMTWPFIPLGSIRIVVALSAFAVLIFNTAAIFAMLSHYKEDKEFIYSLDIHYLDEISKNKQ